MFKTPNTSGQNWTIFRIKFFSGIIALDLSNDNQTKFVGHQDVKVGNGEFEWMKMDDPLTQSSEQ